tara:strand:- start:87 stop:650 length:564 start_codon:yes stop_codon:yes gene_type:complete
MMKKIKTRYKFRNCFEKNNHGNRKCHDWLVRELRDKKIYVHVGFQYGFMEGDRIIDKNYEYFHLAQGGYIYIDNYIPPDDILNSCYLDYIGFDDIEVEYEEKVVKLKRGRVKGKLNWKSSNRGSNSTKKGVRLKPSHDTKLAGPTRKYEFIKEDGFTRPNKSKPNLNSKITKNSIIEIKPSQLNEDT